MKIIAFPYHDWRKGQAESFRTRDGHLLEALAEHPSVEQVLVIDRPVSRSERLLRRSSPFVRGSMVADRRLDGREARLTRVGPRTIVLDIADPAIVAPLVRHRGWWFDVFNDSRTQRAIDWAIRETSMETAGVIAWVPTVATAVAKLGPTHFAFDSLDNWLTHPTLRRHAREAMQAYEEIGRIATSAFVPSRASLGQLRGYIPQLEILANGVDIEAFRGEKPRPDDLPGSPVVGYVGKLGVRLDGPLIREVAKRLPAVQFAFVGPTLEADAVRPFARMPNVTLLGDRPYDAVPAYVRNFDIAWIPHRVGEGETGGDLIKKYEYWAADRQVVSTRVGETDAWADQLHLAGDAEGLANLLDGILKGEVEPKATRIPPSRTWQAIADRIVQSLASAGPMTSR